MITKTMTTGMSQACLRCKRQKRKCDRIVPACSLCLRLNRRCHYEVADGTARALPVPDLLDLTPPNISQTLEGQVSAVIGHGPRLHEAAHAYFSTVHPWLPVISEAGHYHRLSVSRTQPMKADFSLLTLTMFLICALPENGKLPARTTSLYALLKSFVGMLEALNINSIEMLHTRLLISIFEAGHGLLPAAYISAGSNLRAAVAVGANAPSSDTLLKRFGSAERAVSVQRTWRGLVIANRYATLLSGEHEGFCSLSKNPAEVYDYDTVKPDAMSSHIDAFTKLAHASRLVEQALTHTHEVTPHHEFNTSEAIQIITTATSLMATFADGDPSERNVSSSSLALCRSAMMEILSYGCHVKNPDSETCNLAALNMLKSTLQGIVHGATQFLANPTSRKFESLSIFVAQPIYRSAMIYLRLLDPSDRMDVAPSIKPLKDLLDLFSRRWTAAGRYLEEIELCEQDE